VPESPKPGIQNTMADHSRQTKTTGPIMTVTKQILDYAVTKQIVTKQELFQDQAPCWNFELNADQLLAKALEVGYVTKVEGQPDSYLVNNDYG
jgi:hypothetical protein